MKGDIPAPAFRLLTQSTVRTHYAPDRSPRPSYQGVGRGNGQAVTKPLKVGAVTYPSLNAAMRELRIGNDQIKRLIRNGDAQYV